MSWTEEQLALLRLDSSLRAFKLPVVAVSADAGSGKTSVLVERVKVLLNTLSPKARVLCVSFTVRSCADLKARLSDFSKVEIFTIHGFCSYLTTQFGSKLGISPVLKIIDELKASELLSQTIQKVYRRNPILADTHSIATWTKLCEQAVLIGLKELALNIPENFNETAQKFVRSVLIEYTLAKKKLHCLDYSDLEIYALQILEDPKTLALVQNRYAHVFVDEFQDTSPVQCRLVEKICALDQSRPLPVFVVGDSKQSIYRFRGADLESFEAFLKKVPTHRRLSSNFRSDPVVIEAVNVVCGPILKEYQPMIAARSSCDNLELKFPRLGMATAESDSDGIVFWINELRSHGVKTSDIVLILRKIRGNEELFTQLQTHNIPLVISSSTSIQVGSPLHILSNLWIWAVQPWQKLREAQVIYDFKTDKGQLLLQEQLPLFLNQLGFLNCEELLNKLDVFLKLQQNFGPSFELFRTLILQCQSEGMTPASVARRFQQNLQSDRPEIRSISSPPPPENLEEMHSGLRVLTVHSAKGLEFPFVILADVDSEVPKKGAVFKRGNSLWLLGRDEDGSLDKSNIQFQEALQYEQFAEQEERARLLYVAMTRAREALFVVRTNVALEKQNRALLSSREVKPTWGLWLQDGFSKLPSVHKVSVDVQTKRKESAISSAISKEVTDSESLELIDSASYNYSRLRIGVTDLIKEQNPLVVHGLDAKIFSQKKSSELGTEVHRLLQQENWDGLAKFATARGLSISAFFNWLGSDDGNQIFPKNSAKAKKFEIERIEKEFAIEWKADQQTIVGRLDRLVVFKKSAWIIDYKVIAREISSESFRASYQKQLQIYEQAIRKFLPGIEVKSFLLDVLAATGQILHSY